MSLINDALRRASQSEKERARPAASTLGMEPAPVAKRSALPLYLGLGIVVALALAGWFFWRGVAAGHAVKTEVRIVPPPKLQVVQTAPVIVVTPPKAAPVVPVPVPAPAPVPVVKETHLPEPWPSDLKLKGIFYNRANPRALINGTSLAIGETIQGVRVTKIEPDRVTLEWQRQTKILLEGQ